MPIANVATTDTFRTWYTRTNEAIHTLNTKTPVDGQVVFGVYTIGANTGTSFSVANGLFVNTSTILTSSNTIFGANVTITANANVFSVASNVAILQPLNGTLVNSAFTVNGTALFLSNVSANANVSVNGTFSVVGPVSLTGTTTANGIIYTRQTAFSGANSVLAPTSLSDPQYDNYNPVGLNDAQVLCLTPLIDTVVTGLQAPSGLGSTGARVLHIQNLSPTYKITFPSANNSSGANNQWLTPSNIPYDLLPGASISVLWTTTNHHYRILAPITQLINLTVPGTATFNGAVTFSNTLTANSSTASYIRNLSTTTFTNNSTATFANVTVTGATALANVTVTSSNSFFQNNGEGVIWLSDTGGGTNAKNWRMAFSRTGFSLSTATDAFATVNAVFSISRSLGTATGMTIVPPLTVQGTLSANVFVANTFALMQRVPLGAGTANSVTFRALTDGLLYLQATTNFSSGNAGLVDNIVIETASDSGFTTDVVTFGMSHTSVSNTGMPYYIATPTLIPIKRNEYFRWYHGSGTGLTANVMSWFNAFGVAPSV